MSKRNVKKLPGALHNFGQSRLEFIKRTCQDHDMKYRLPLKGGSPSHKRLCDHPCSGIDKNMFEPYPRFPLVAKDIDKQA
ncbi:MAG: hypothetical protein F9K48_07285 [Candidatus Brocadia sp.]|nr:MAG: hypothetical protein F9K48_07285 [Candidatus Brocadia sp.]